MIIELENFLSYNPFKVEYDLIENEVYQVSIDGIGCINYFDKMNESLLNQIKSNINFSLESHQHLNIFDINDIGYHIKYNSTGKINKVTSTEEISISISIVFKNTFQLSNIRFMILIELLSNIILQEIFVLSSGQINPSTN